MYQFDLRPMRTWSPSFEKEVEKLFDGFGRSQSYTPACDIVDSEKHFAISLDIPGLTKEDLEIEVKDNHLHITGTRKTFQREEKDQVVRTERRFGQFARVFTLPQNVKQEAIEANVENGVLAIILPKEEKAQSKKITIGAAPVLKN